nr:MAG TPA: hypothetical protein [Bacteriophage sp.]
MPFFFLPRKIYIAYNRRNTNNCDIAFIFLHSFFKLTVASRYDVCLCLMFFSFRYK